MATSGGGSDLQQQYWYQMPSYQPGYHAILSSAYHQPQAIGSNVGSSSANGFRRAPYQQHQRSHARYPQRPNRRGPNPALQRRHDDEVRRLRSEMRLPLNRRDYWLDRLVKMVPGEKDAYDVLKRALRYVEEEGRNEWEFLLNCFEWCETKSQSDLQAVFNVGSASNLLCEVRGFARGYDRKNVIDDEPDVDDEREQSEQQQPQDEDA